jgi:hypothetical protein
MIAPLLPGAEELVGMLKEKVDHVLIDRLNYHYADWAYKKYGMQGAMDDEFFYQKSEKLRAGFKKAGIACQSYFGTGHDRPGSILTFSKALRRASAR